MSRYFSSKYAALTPYTPGEQPRDMRYIKLNTNESPYPPSPLAREYARKNGCASVRADTHRGNRAMRGLLEKCGYCFCGEVNYPVVAGDPVRVAYELPLEPK